MIMENNKIKFNNRLLSKAINFVLLACLVVLVSACSGKDISFDWRRPAALNVDPPEGPKPYRQGWSDGCESGLSSTSNKLHQLLGSYKFTLNTKLQNDPLYSRAWRYGYNHCGYSMRSLAQYSF